MERPVKRLKVTRSESRSPRETGSKMAEGLFTTEMGMRSDDRDGKNAMPSRTISLSDLRRRLYREKPQRRQILPRGNEGILLRPRAPDATVTATVVDVNVADGTSTVSATEVTIASEATVVSLSDYSGSLTVPGISSTVDDSATTTTDNTGSSGLATSTTDSTTTSTSLNAAASILSAALTAGNGTITGAESTVTVTATSTFEISYINGTFVPLRTATDHLTVTKHTSRHSLTDISNINATQPATDSNSASPTDSTINSATAYPGSNPSTAATIAPGASTPGSSSTTTAGAPNKSSSTNTGPGLSPTQQQMVGGVVGGVAGLALVLVFLLILLRWYRRRLKARGELPEQRELHSRRGLMASPGNTMDASRGQDIVSHSRNSSGIPFAAAAAMIRRWRPHSGATFATTATGASTAAATNTTAEGGSEKGFQRIAGRKIAPVLSSGGDGFGGDYGAFEKDAASAAGAGAGAGVGASRNGDGSRDAGVATPTDTKRVERKLSRNSFYREKDHGGFYADRERASSVPASPRTPNTTMLGNMETRFPTPPGPSGSSNNIARDFASHDEIRQQLPRGMGVRSEIDLNAHASRPEGFAVLRPSPARTPTTGSVNVSEVRLSIPRGEEAALGLVDGERTPPMPMGMEGVRGRLMVPGVRGSPAVSRGSGGSRFREGIA